MKEQKVFIIDKPEDRVIEVLLEREDVQLEVIVLVYANTPGEYKLNVRVEHRVGNNNARIWVRGVVGDGATLDMSGMIKINKDARGVDDFLEMRALMWGKSSVALAEPQLEIEANQVKASHAAAVGRMDEEQLFYLQSRGMKRKKAEKMIVDGFMGELTSKIEDKRLWK
ncbi:hypothetical protein A2368_02630 [Candidatus Collierbacteria bacterium RIFOXYB1_FULL_49_13]|uniref:SUF system FeS cluster assembly SufBD core domain-containing protein n=1 Tax=Candidatus Collierbacteria bacterium RIFOXYB1_FULL_49_13 TaxID=1817728 RepID=A0A1F5FJ10_9BACT|nr:MAG: hypothetical protein A2368_02630 [Candidatus Collierbacteria bacterium RIFOXYB1_FULL_49_13]